MKRPAELKHFLFLHREQMKCLSVDFSFTFRVVILALKLLSHRRQTAFVVISRGVKSKTIADVPGVLQFNTGLKFIVVIFFFFGNVKYRSTGSDPEPLVKFHSCGIEVDFVPMAVIPARARFQTTKKWKLEMIELFITFRHPRPTHFAD